MRIEFNDEDDELAEALREIHRLSRAYEGPMMYEFMELAELSAPMDSDAPADEGPRGDSPRARNVERSSNRNIKAQFEEALSLLMVLAFPLNSKTEQAVRHELNESLGNDQKIESMQMLFGNRRSNLKSNLGRPPTRQQVELRKALIELLPNQPQGDL